jgi:hypothetical protein
MNNNMKQLRYLEEGKCRELKPKLAEYLKSETFQKAFRQMVSKSIRSGAETGFGMGVGFARTPKFQVGKIDGGYSPVSIGGTESLERDEDIFPESLTRFSKYANLLRCHTHPILFNNPYVYIPSDADVKSLSSWNALFGLVVPVDLASKELLIVAFQPVNHLSNIAYDNLKEEVGFLGDDISHKILRLAVERSILRVLEFGARKNAVFAPAEIDLMLDTFQFRPLLQRAW